MDKRAIIEEAEDFVESQVMPIVRQKAGLEVSPVEYRHKVKHPAMVHSTIPDLLRAIGQTLTHSNGLSLYFHMPMCGYRCSWCHYPVVVGRDSMQRHAFVEALVNEARIF